MPDFVDDFIKEYPEFWKKGIVKPFDALYKTEIGKLAQAFSFGLKDSTTHVVMMQNFLISCKNPKDVFLESKENEFFMKKYSEIKKKYKALVDEAKKNIGGKLIFFEYGGDLSISSEIANELMYLFPGKIIAVCYKKGAATNISLRGNRIRNILENVLSNMKNASGGGHKNAVGARIKTEDLKRFKELLLEEISNG
jgi:oligoribonuclease NrnB/cAMP/cGMP phosphodiesterase (DHH superfamily)